MFAINHAAAALAVKKKFSKADMLWILISVQLIEILWVVLNFINVEFTTTEDTVKYIGDIHLSYMPFSHSVISTVIIASVSYVVIKYLFKKNNLALPFAIGVLSHIILDIFTHSKDIAIFFGGDPKIGTRLYPAYPYIAFILELAFGVWCWWYYKGNKTLLAVIVLFNFANFTVFSPDIVGLEKYFANNPILLTSVIGAQILITLLLVGYLYNNKTYSYS